MRITKGFNRIISLLLAFVMMVGLIPAGVMSPARAADTGGVPQTIKFGGETRGHHYMSPNWSSKQTYLQIFTMKDGSNQEYVGLCGNRQKGPPTSGATFSLSWVKTGDEIPGCAWLLDHYFYKKSIGACDDYEEMMFNSYAQFALWFYLEGRLNLTPDMDSHSQEWIDLMTPIANEREIALGTYNPAWTLGVDGSLALFQAMWDEWKAGEYDIEGDTPGTYALYTPDSGHSSEQPILIRIPNEFEEERVGWIGLKKTNIEGAALPGAQFSVYEDAACTVPAQTPSQTDAIISTGADGTGTVQVKWRSDSTTKDYWIKETVAPPGAQLRSNVWKVTVSSINNAIESNAVQVNGGTGIPNGTSQEPKGIVQKIDANTHESIGPATFHFEGQAKDGTFVSADFDCDESGNLELQWTKPEEEKYIKPGNYTVTEVTPPPGYEKTDRAQNLVLDVEFGWITVFANYSILCYPILEATDTMNSCHQSTLFVSSCNLHFPKKSPNQFLRI